MNDKLLPKVTKTQKAAVLKFIGFSKTFAAYAAADELCVGDNVTAENYRIAGELREKMKAEAREFGFVILGSRDNDYRVIPGTSLAAI